MGNTCANGNIDDHFPDDVANRSFEAYIEEQNKHIPQTGEIKVLTYNIFIRPPGISNNGNDYKDERLDQFLQHIHSYDIICLQEMFGAYSNRRDEFIRKAKDLGFLYIVTSPRPDYFSNHFSDGGLVIMSRYPIIASEYMEYCPGVGSDYYCQKGVLYAMVRVGKARLHVFNTHAQATYDENLKWFYKRTEQFASFNKFMRKMLTKHRYRGDDMVLLTGDFNVNNRDPRRFHFKRREQNPLFDSIKSLLDNRAFSEYDALMCCLTDNGTDQVEDLLRKKYKESPITYGDYYCDVHGKKIPIETCLTDKLGLCTGESLDYIFQYIPKGLPQMTRRRSQIQQAIEQQGLEYKGQSYDELVKPLLNIRPETVSVDKFEVKGHPFNFLSDHYGVSVVLEYTKPPMVQKLNSDDSDTKATTFKADDRDDSMIFIDASKKSSL